MYLIFKVISALPHKSLSYLQFSSNYDHNTYYETKHVTALLIGSTELIQIELVDHFDKRTTTSLSGAKTAAIIYINSLSNTVSVINTTNYALIKNITVRQGPGDILRDPLTKDIYIVNTFSDGVSVINYATNKVVARVAFDVSPFKTGDIVCHTDLGELDIRT